MTKAIFLLAAAAASMVASAAAFLPANLANFQRAVSTIRTDNAASSATLPIARRRATRHRSSSLQMCICIHCARVTNCSGYHFVEEQHNQPHINKNPTWEPRNGSPTIQVHIRPDGDRKAQNELEKMWDEHEDETRLAEMKAQIENSGSDEPLIGSKQYDLSAVNTYEYDVVQCEDFLEEKDAWVKNMPEEIRLANPHFVPT
mmetsp:Transcript_28249/g.59416  ORF Transcript_28249/g.59416 Transcript_28249/m.59416 type:complete len:202 (-) Transcript_28249:275-880(-)